MKTTYYSSIYRIFFVSLLNFLDFFYPHTYCTINIFFAHLDRNNPQIDPFFLFKKKLVMANLRCPTLRLRLIPRHKW